MIKLENISHKFDNTLILNKINFSFDKKKYLIIGPSGIGKTTLLNIINKNLQPTNGNVTSKLRTEMIFQDFKLLEDFTIKENIDIALQINKIENEYLNIIELLGIKNILNKFPKEISGGEKQRAAIARALALDAKIIIADEPTSNLDQNNAKNILEVFENIHNTLNIGFIISSHDVLWETFAQTKLTIKNGELIPC